MDVCAGGIGYYIFGEATKGLTHFMGWWKGCSASWGLLQECHVPSWWRRTGAHGCRIHPSAQHISACCHLSPGGSKHVQQKKAWLVPVRFTVCRSLAARSWLVTYTGMPGRNSRLGRLVALRCLAVTPHKLLCTWPSCSQHKHHWAQGRKPAQAFSGHTLGSPQGHGATELSLTVGGLMTCGTQYCFQAVASKLTALFAVCRLGIRLW